MKNYKIYPGHGDITSVALIYYKTAKVRTPVS